MSIISLCRIGLEGKPSIASIGGPSVVRPSSPGLAAPHRWIEVGLLIAHGAAVVQTRVLNNLNAFGALAITTDPSACYC